MNNTENSTEQKQPKLSPADFQFFTKHLLAIMNHPNAPEALQKGILEGIELLENEVSIKADNPHVIKNALLAYATDGFTVDTEQFEPKETDVISELYAVAENAPREVKRYLLDYIFEKTGVSVEITDEPPSIADLSLPELLSAAIKHPDMPENLRVDMWNWFANEVNAEIGDSDSPEWFASVLGIKNYRRKESEQPACNPFKIGETVWTENPEFKGVKPLIDELLRAGECDDDFTNAFICLLEAIKKRDKLDILNFIDAVQSYAFSWTVGFDQAFEAYKAKLDCSRLAPEQNESTEQRETYHAATVETHSTRKLDPMLGKQ